MYPSGLRELICNQPSGGSNPLTGSKIMDKKFDKKIPNYINGCYLTSEFMNLLKELNPEYYKDFMKSVKEDCLSGYRSVEQKYIDQTLYNLMHRYHETLLDLLDRCSPPNYYFGQCNQKLQTLYGNSYGFWRNDPKFDIKNAIIKNIIKIKNEFDRPFKGRYSYILNLEDSDLEEKLQRMGNENVLDIYKNIISIASVRDLLGELNERF